MSPLKLLQSGNYMCIIKDQRKIPENKNSLSATSEEEKGIETFPVGGCAKMNQIIILSKLFYIQ